MTVDQSAAYGSFDNAMISCISTLIVVISLLMGTLRAHAAIDVYEFDDPRQEAQYRGLIEEFRCPKCQNQNLAGSDSQISLDLKRKTYEMVMEGRSDAEIRAYMFERYGDFISYKPPVRPSTWILWYFPPFILLILVGWWFWRNARKTTKLVEPVSVDGNMDDNRVTESNHLVANALKAESNNGVKKANTTIFDKNSISKIGSGLSEDEAKKLDALINKHGSKKHD